MSMTWEEVVALIDGTGVAHLSTTSAADGAHVSQVFAGVEGKRLTFTTRTTSADSPGWLVVSVVPVRAIAMLQTSEGLVRRTWHA